ncbi:tyrosine-type recombinase/integrase [Paenibacillus agricola]|uniref:Tyrosine-type recombinase/integrase n=1 Tax=Paenibacillus agricola TaxID=2716264 RepID=A0ABX0JCU9_9BACL|nr:site-specific integrase [Paenibacillus agricola]NHN33205.1 tyrosine-type recombinase/integrase [Paenibacillus agricola]
MLSRQSDLSVSNNWLNPSIFYQISSEHFKNTDWTSLPDLLLMYVFLHDEPTYGKKRAQGTKEEYLRDILDFLKFTESFGGIRQLSPEDLLVYQDSLASRYANTSNQKKITVVKQFLRYIFSKQAINTDLTRLIKKVSQPADELVNRDLYEHEAQTLLKYFKKENFIMYTFFLLLVSTGLRINELATAKWKNLYYVPRLGFHFLDVIGKGSKPREILIFDDTFEAIGEFRKRRGLTLKIDPGCPSPFFPKGTGDAYNSKYLSNMFTKAIIKTDLTIIKHRTDSITPHTCRHYYASFLTSEGANIDAVKDALGHSSIITTQRYLLKRRRQENHAAIKVGRNSFQ